jgi:DNA polymerase-4
VLRQILHVGVADFAVAVERVVDPSLRGRPVVVAPPGGPRALVTSASFEAVREGIRVGMSLTRAERVCRRLMVLVPNPKLYERAGRALQNLCGRYSPLVEPGPMGRSFIDLTGTERLFGVGRDCAVRLQREIRSDLGLDASVGVGTNKLVSRVASDVIAPPPGVEDVAGGCEERFLAPLPVGRLPGVGRKTIDALADFNVNRVGELARVPVRHLVIAFGQAGFSLHRKSRGVDSTPVYPPRNRPAVGEEEEFNTDTNDYSYLLNAVCRVVERAARRLREMRMVGGRLGLRLRYSDGREARGSLRLPCATNLDSILFDAARDLFAKVLERRVRVRTLALSIENLAEAPAQMPLFAVDDTLRATALLAALDCIRSRYGQGAILRGV